MTYARGHASALHRCGGSSVARRRRAHGPSKQGSQHHRCIATLRTSRTHDPTKHACTTTIRLQNNNKIYRKSSATTKSQQKCSSTRTPPTYVPNPNPHPSTNRTNITQLIAQCVKNFRIDGDRDSLLRISDSLSTLSQFRTQHLSSLQSTLSKLNRQHQTLSSQHNHTLSQHNPTTHASEILRLDTEKFKIAKQASDLEIEGERLQSELGRLGGVLGELEEEGVEGGEREKPVDEDATV